MNRFLARGEAGRRFGAPGIGLASLLALVAGCDTPPAGIPDSPGTIDAATLPDLITIGSPDLPFLLWLTPAQLAEQDWRDCPKVYLRSDGMTATANDCVDSSGIRWFGSVSVSYDPEDRRQTVNLQDFGADDGENGWMADGRVSIEFVKSGEGYLVDTNASVVSLAGEQSTLFWANTESAYTTYDGIWYADRHDGVVGMEGWGTAEITTRNTPLAELYDCGWAAHIAGSMAIDGKNEAFINFYTGFLEPVSLPPPADTGGDTGGPADTGGDTGSGETGDTDTGESDTDTDTDTDSGFPDFDDDDDPDGACGTCRDAEISGTELAECLDLTRSFTWPFPPPF